MLGLNNVELTSKALHRYVSLIEIKLEDTKFRTEIHDINSKKKKLINFNKNILSLDEVPLNNDFKNRNKKWLGKCEKFAFNMYHLLHSEILKCEILQDNLKIVDQENRLENEEFLLSIRLIKYLIYRLTRIKYFKLYIKSDKVLLKVLDLIQFFFPVRLIGLLLFRYNHIDMLKDLLELSMEVLERNDQVSSRKIYPNDIAYLIHLLGSFYQENPEKLNDDFEFWRFKINTILLLRLYEEKLAITEFILKLKLTNKFSYSKWKFWIEQADNLLILKNILLCIAYHKDSPPTIPNDFKNLILKNYRYDESLMIITMKLWYKIKSNKSKNEIDIFNTGDFFHNIKQFPDQIDLDYELKSIFDWDEGFDVTSPMN